MKQALMFISSGTTRLRTSKFFFIIKNRFKVCTRTLTLKPNAFSGSDGFSPQLCGDEIISGDNYIGFPNIVALHDLNYMVFWHKHITADSLGIWALKYTKVGSTWNPGIPFTVSREYVSVAGKIVIARHPGRFWVIWVNKEANRILASKFYSGGD